MCTKRHSIEASIYRILIYGDTIRNLRFNQDWFNPKVNLINHDIRYFNV